MCNTVFIINSLLKIIFIKYLFVNYYFDASILLKQKQNFVDFICVLLYIYTIKREGVLKNLLI